MCCHIHNIVALIFSLQIAKLYVCTPLKSADETFIRDVKLVRLFWDA